MSVKIFKIKFFLFFFCIAYRTSLWPFGEPSLKTSVNQWILNLKTLSLSLSPFRPILYLLSCTLLSFSDFLVCPQGPPSISQALSALNWTGQGASDVAYTRIINWLTKRFPLTSCPACEALLHALVLHVKAPPCQPNRFLCLFVCTHAPVPYTGHCRTWISYFVAGALTCSNLNKGHKRFGRGPGSLLIGVRSMFSLFFCSLVASAWHTCCNGTMQPRPENPPTM